MVLNYRQYYDKMTYPRNVMFAIFFHDIIYDPQVRWWACMNARGLW